MDNVDYNVEDLILLDDKKLLVEVPCNGRVFKIKFGPEDLRDPAISHGDSEGDTALQHSDSEDDMDTLSMSNECCYQNHPLESFILAPFLKHEIFTKFAPKSSKPSISTLSDVLSPPLLLFGLRTVDRDLVPINLSLNSESETLTAPSACLLVSKARCEYPIIRPEDIPISSISQPNFNLVSFHNRICWFKPVCGDIGDSPHIREIDILFQISQMNLTLRIPKLHAFVASERANAFASINGFILDAIYPNRGAIQDRLREGKQDIPVTLRKRWCNYVEDMVRILHQHDLIWGDVSGENMIIDEEDNIWMIDFGGGWTDDWVEPENQNTRIGDLQGVERLREYLLG